MDNDNTKPVDTGLLLFILIYLLLFYDDSYLRRTRNIQVCRVKQKDPAMLFFILVFLLLFY